MFRILFAIGWILSTAVYASVHTGDTEAQIKANLSNGDAILVDVREIDEWNLGHIADALNLPLSLLREEAADIPLPEDAIIYLHCQTGRRVLPAAEILRQAGYREVRALAWGYPELLRRGFNNGRE